VSAIDLHSDNQAAIALLKNPIASNRSKHIDVLHHFARERVCRGEVALSYCNTAAMLADCLTKLLFYSAMFDQLNRASYTSFG
jgi:hypothetical protein